MDTQEKIETKDELKKLEEAVKTNYTDTPSIKWLEHFKIQVYFLTDSKAEEELLIYNKKTNKFNCYSKTRAVNIFLKGFIENNMGSEFKLDDFFSEMGYDRDTKPLLTKMIQNEASFIKGISFKPSTEKIFEKDNELYFNTFAAPETFFKDKYELDSPMSYDEFKRLAPYHHKLFMNLHNHDQEAIKDTLLKLADKIRYPDQKAQDCIVFFPGEAAGKGIFYKHVLQPIFGKYARKTLMKKLTSDFNGFLEEPLILVLEEGKRDIELIETLKEAITEGTMLINKKGKNQEEKEVYFLTFVFSNHMNPIDLGKRRGSYHLTHSLGSTVEESQEIGAEICENLPNETDYLLKYLHNLEFNHQQALMPFGTNAKTLVNDLNKSPIETFYDYLTSFDTWDQAINSLTDLYSLEDYLIDFKPRKSGEEEAKYIAKELYKEAYNQWCIRENLRNNIIKHNKDIVQLWALMKIPEDSHKRINVHYGKFANRKLDFIKLKDIADHYIEVNENA